MVSAEMVVIHISVLRYFPWALSKNSFKSMCASVAQWADSWK